MNCAWEWDVIRWALKKYLLKRRSMFSYTTCVGCKFSICDVDPTNALRLVRSRIPAALSYITVAMLTPTTADH